MLNFIEINLEFFEFSHTHTDKHTVQKRNRLQRS